MARRRTADPDVLRVRCVVSSDASKASSLEDAQGARPYLHCRTPIAWWWCPSSVRCTLYADEGRVLGIAIPKLVVRSLVYIGGLGTQVHTNV